jgi:hypothetical protein
LTKAVLRYNVLLILSELRLNFLLLLYVSRTSNEFAYEVLMLLPISVSFFWTVGLSWRLCKVRIIFVW